MTLRILLNESNASRRCVPIMCFKSDGTSACTNESGRTFMFSVGGVFYGSGGSVSAVSSVDGMYMCNFSASKVSVMGQGMVQYSSNTALPWMTPFEVVPYDSYDSMRLGLFALPNAAPAAAGGVLTVGTGTGQITPSGGSVGIVPGTLSGVSVEVKSSGIVVASVAKGNYSGVSFEILTGGIQTTSIGAGSYSGVSVEIKSGGIQTGSVGAGSYSGVSVEVKTGGIQTASIGKGAYSGVSVEVTTGGIQPASVGAGLYSAVTIDGLSNKTFFQASVQSSVWSGKRSDWTTPGSFGEYAYSQVTGTSSGTVQGVTRSLFVTEVSLATLAPGTHSGATIQGLSNYANISNVTLAAGTHSNVTIQGVTRINSGVTLNADVHSGASVEIKAGGIQATSLGAATITSAKFAASAIDAVALATDAGQEIADRILGRNIAGGSDGGRIVSEALYPLRNRVAIGGSTVTIYQVDDTTSAWTGTITTGTNPIAGIDPVGP